MTNKNQKQEIKTRIIRVDSEIDTVTNNTIDEPTNDLDKMKCRERVVV